MSHDRHTNRPQPELSPVQRQITGSKQAVAKQTPAPSQTPVATQVRHAS